LRLELLPLLEDHVVLDLAPVSVSQVGIEEPFEEEVGAGLSRKYDLVVFRILLQ
jgi:hypothetical protein